MDTATEPIRELPSDAFNRATDTRDMPARAAQRRAAYNLDDDLIIDIDAHHFETQSWDEIVGYIEDPVIRDIAYNRWITERVVALDDRIRTCSIRRSTTRRRASAWSRSSARPGASPASPSPASTTGRSTTIRPCGSTP